MYRALTHLIFLRFRGGVRRRCQALQSIRGIAFFVLTALAVPFLLGPIRQMGELLSAPGTAPSGGGNLGAVGMDDYLPLLLALVALITVITSTGSAIHFSPAERNFLLSGPFSRRALLHYKLVVYLVGAVISAAVVTFMVSLRTSAWPSAFVGSVLALFFFQLSSAVIGSTSRFLWRAAPGSSYWRPVAWSCLLLCAWPLAYCLTRESFEFVVRASASPLGQITLGPFIVLSRVMLARSIGGLFLWGALALLIDVLLAFLLVRIDQLALASGLDLTLEPHRRESARQDHGICSSRALRRIMWIGDAAPIVWKQLTNATRTHGKVLLGLAVLSLAGGPLLLRTLQPISPLARLGTVIVFAIFIFPKSLAFDFRGEMDMLSYYKRLPLKPSAIAGGQILAPAVITSLLQWILLLGSLPLFGSSTDRTSLLLLGAFVLPFNVLLYGLENVLFLLFPTRMLPVGRIDFEFFGRNVLELFVKGSLLISALLVSGHVAFAFANYIGGGRATYLIVAWFCLSFWAWLSIQIVARIFQGLQLGMIHK